MKLPVRFALFTLVGFLYGCGAPTAVRDQRPSFVDREQLRPTIFFGNLDDTTVSAGSAVILDGQHVLTNWHVWSGEERWWEHLPERSLRLVFDRDGEPSGSKKTRFRRLEFSLVAAGEIQAAEKQEELRFDQRHLGDWVVLRTDHPIWREEDAVVLHAPALDPNWSVALDRDLCVIGYSFLWNDATERLELIGVFHSWSQVDVKITRRVEPLGLSALAFHYTSRGKSAGLYYTPLSTLAPALEEHGVIGSPIPTTANLPR